jgi:hypothetical protein
MRRKLAAVFFLFELTEDNKTCPWDGFFSKRFLAVEDKIRPLVRGFRGEFLMFHHKFVIKGQHFMAQ